MSIGSSTATILFTLFAQATGARTHTTMQTASRRSVSRAMHKPVKAGCYGGIDLWRWGKAGAAQQRATSHRRSEREVIATVHRAVKNGPSAVGLLDSNRRVLFILRVLLGALRLETSRAISACSMGIPTCRFARIHLVHSRAEGLSLGLCLKLQVFFVWKRKQKRKRKEYVKVNVKISGYLEKMQRLYCSLRRVSHHIAS